MVVSTHILHNYLTNKNSVETVLNNIESLTHQMLDQQTIHNHHSLHQNNLPTNNIALFSNYNTNIHRQKIKITPEI